MTLKEVAEERHKLLDHFEVLFTEAVGLFCLADTCGTEAEVTFYSDPNEKYSLLSKEANEIYTHKITYGYGKLARHWRLTVSTSEGEKKPLSDGSLSIRLAFLQIHKELLSAITANMQKDNDQIKRFIDQYT